MTERDNAVEHIYAPKSAAKIDEAAHLIRKAANLLDRCGDSHVIALVEAVEGSEHITTDLAERLTRLAGRLDS
jgi:hypothetical protein